jgi:predicted dehydrogenase
VGGKGWTDVTQVGATENIVGLCDVDSGRLAQAGKTFTSARRFADWREMFDQLGNQIDAVTVSTPDHTHFPPSMRAVQHGWHVY